MDKIDNGGQAFPAADGPDEKGHLGMTLLDWFAGQALTRNDVDSIQQAYDWAESMIFAKRRREE